MAQTLILGRDDAELLAELLMLSDYANAHDLGCAVRELFGMVSEEQELTNMGKTKAEFRAACFDKLLPGHPPVSVAKERQRCAYWSALYDHEGYAHHCIVSGREVGGE